MAITIDTVVEGGPLELDEYIDMLETDYDVLDSSSLIESAPLLRRVSENKSLFLQEINKLLRRIHGTDDGNPYSVQSYMFRERPKFSIRANIWVKPRDYGAGTNWESRAFIYGGTHNHKFDFLTVGHFGAGYWTTIYELESDLIGYPGEPVKLRQTEHTSLPTGKVMYFRKFIDVHTQLAPEDELSISLNLMVTDHAALEKNQYEFNVEKRLVIGVVNRYAKSSELLFKIAKAIGNSESREICEQIVASSTHTGVRLQAMGALLGNANQFRKTLKICAGDKNEIISSLARAALDSVS